MKKWNLVIDVAKCFNCQACAITCHDEYHGNDFPGYAAGMPNHQRWIEIKTREKGRCPMVEVAYLPVTCNHCDDAPCLRAAQDGAVRKRPDGIVIIDPERAKGQRQLVAACPYGAITWNEERSLPQAWPFDAHLLDQGWTKTRGAQACATQAMRVLNVEDAEMQRIAREEKLEVLHPEYGTKPRVYYKNLDRWFKAFIGGTLAGEVDSVQECIAGARVTLKRDAATVAETTSDAYGDFKFSSLDEGSGAYRIEIAHERFTTRTVAVELGASTFLGTITLSR